jgi:hypothetical protein
MHKGKPMKLKKIYKQARMFDAAGLASYHHDTKKVKAACDVRDALICLIYRHPKNIYSHRAIMSRVIQGLSGHEDELK